VLHGGVVGIGGEGLHPFGGIEGGVLRGRLGAAAVGQLGRGNAFRSTLVAAGPAVEVAGLRRASVVVHGGPVRYVERVDAGVARRLHGLYGGVSVRLPLGRRAVGLGATVWHGSARGEGIDHPESVTGHRFHLGIGL
jgi:hypothetical protein